MINTTDIHALSLSYNTDRDLLAMPEYGRHVQSMVDLCKTIPDRGKRNEAAHAIVEVIGALNPHLRDTADFRHKLWSHLFVMAQFDLDVDSPYPIPTRESLISDPEKVPYPVKSTAHRHYGNIIKDMIQKAVVLPEGEERNALIFDIANQMKRSYLTWNKDHVDDAVIFKELRILSGGVIHVENMELTIQQGIAIKYAPLHTKKKKPTGFFKRGTAPKKFNRK